MARLASRVSPSKRLLSSSSKRDPSGNEIAQFLKRKDAPGAAFEANRLDLSGAHLSEKPAAVRQAAECIVVVHHGFVVRADLEIGLNSVTGGDCRRKGGGSVFDRSGR